MGLFDLPANIFTWLDANTLAWASPLFKIIIWGAIGGIISMLLYSFISQQQRMAAIKKEIANVRSEIDKFEGEFSEVLPLILNSLKLSFQQIGITLIPAIVASFPALCLIVWISNNYGYEKPEPNQEITITAFPNTEAISSAGNNLQNQQVIYWPNNQMIVELSDSTQKIAEITTGKLSSVIHKKLWWNKLIANPAGYIPEESPIERIDIHINKKRYLNIGASWMQSWEFTFFLAMIISSLAIKIIFRIH